MNIAGKEILVGESETLPWDCPVCHSPLFEITMAAADSDGVIGLRPIITCATCPESALKTKRWIKDQIETLS